MFYKKSRDHYKEVLKGIRLKTLVHGDRTLLCEFLLEEGCMLPIHSHPHEQTGYLMSGRINLIIGDEKFEAGPGDSWCIPGDKDHGAEAWEDSVVLEVFSPVREDYLF